MGARRRARERVLQVLYAFHVGEEHSKRSDPHSDPQLNTILNDFSGRFPSESGKQDRKEDAAYARSLLAGILSMMSDLDDRVTRAGSSWRIDRMDPVDLCIIRMAVYELEHVDDVPAAVAINEAVELARLYGSEHSAAFVNGVLDRVRKDLESG